MAGVTNTLLDVVVEMVEHDPPGPEERFATDLMVPQVYDALRELAELRMTRQMPGQSISRTELVHEVYLRLSKEGADPKWANRNQFFCAAAEAMRRVLIDRIRAKHRLKRGGAASRASLDALNLDVPADDGCFAEIDEALHELESIDPPIANMVKMRFFAGMTQEQIAEATGVSTRTVNRQWVYAKGWLAEYLSK